MIDDCCPVSLDRSYACVDGKTCLCTFILVYHIGLYSFLNVSGIIPWEVLGQWIYITIL